MGALDDLLNQPIAKKGGALDALLQQTPNTEKDIGKTTASTGSIALEAFKQFAPQIPRAIGDTLEAPGRYLSQISNKLPTTPMTMPIKVAAFLAPKNDTELALSAAGEMIGPALKITAPYVGKMLANVPPEATERVMQVAGSGKNFLVKVGEDSGLANFLEASRQTFENARSMAGSAIGELISKATKEGTRIDLTPAAQAIEDGLKSIGIRNEADIMRSKSLGSSENIKILKSIAEEIRQNPSVDPKRAWELKKQATDLLDYPITQTGETLREVSAPGAKVVKNFSTSVDNILNPLVPGYFAAKDAFNQIGTTYTLLKKALFRGSAEQKAGQALNPSSPLFKTLSKIEERYPRQVQFINDLKDKVAASKFDEVFPLGNLPKTGYTAGLGGALGFAGGYNPILGVPLAAMTSPRISGLAYQGISGLSQYPGIFGAATRPFTRSNIFGER